MRRTTVGTTSGNNSPKLKSPISKLGRDLRRIRRKIEESGEKLLTRRELRREIAERRGASY